MPMREKLIDIINNFFGCDAAYFDVNQFDLATHLIENGVTILSDDFIISQVSQEEEEKIIKLLRECPVSVLSGGEEPSIEFIGHEHKWIPVTERLPEKDVLVLCVGARGGMFIGYPRWVYEGEKVAYTRVPNSRRGRQTKYWMPLPKPPKEVL